MIELQYIIICILGWVLGVIANEVFVWEIGEERESFPLSQILKRLGLRNILEPIKRSLLRWRNLIGGQTKQKRKDRTGIVLELSVILSILLICFRYDKMGVAISVFTFIYLLIIISIIDLYKMIIPNRLNLILGLVNIIFIVLGWSISWQEALYGALLGGGVLLGIRIFSLIFLKQEGMGIGDIKLGFVCGLYLGWQKVLFGIFSSVYVAGFILMVLLKIKKVKRNQYIPYGPFLSAGFILSLLFYEDIIQSFWWPW